MGGESDAATNVDSIPSPRQAAIHQAEAELSQVLSAREQRREELEFLKKGGNPLDFQFDGSFRLQALSCDRPHCSAFGNGVYVKERQAGTFANGHVCEPENLKVLNEGGDRTGNGHASLLTGSTKEGERKQMCRFQVPPTCAADVREIGNCLTQVFGEIPHENKDKAVVDGDRNGKVTEDAIPGETSPNSVHDHHAGPCYENDGTHYLPKQEILKGEAPAIRIANNDARIASNGERENAKKKTISDAEASKKAQEDSIVEKAEHIKSLRNQVADYARTTAPAVLPRRKTHWDFVLEEMAWMANDFMQERLWKTAAAAQVCRRVAEEKDPTAEIKKNSKKIAHTLANSVLDYWKSSVSEQREGSTQRKPDAVVKEENEAVPMDLDVPDKLSNAKTQPVQSYVLRVLKSADFELQPFDRKLEDFWSNFSEESLFFVVPHGALEAYRLSMEEKWISDHFIQNCANEHDAVSELALESYVDDSRTSPKLPEDDYLHYMPGDMTISKKKRKKVFKAQLPKSIEAPSKRRTSGAASCLGLVPTKRMRTSAAARQRSGAASMSPGPRGNASSASTNSQQDDIFPDSRVSETDSRKSAALRSKKKKRTKNFGDCDPAEEIDSQFRRKGDHFSPMGSDLGPEASWNGGPPAKKAKLSKQSPDEPSAMSKFLRQNNARDRIKRNKLAKCHFGQGSINAPGMGIPWSTIEDQAILALVHDLGPNWDLVSDVLSSSSQLKGIFRKSKDCKDRHKVLLDRLSADAGENSEDPNGSHSLPGIPRGSARILLQRLQGPMEEDTVKVHLERIVNIVQSHKAKQPQNDVLDSQELRPIHQSHLNTAAQFSPLSPLDFFELPISNGDMPGLGYALPPQHAALSMSGGLPSPGMRPGLPLTLPSSAAMNAASAQRMAASMRPLSAEEQRLRYARMLAGRGLQAQGNPPPNAMAMANLPPNSNDCTVPPMLPSAGTAGLIGMNRGIPGMPRPGMPGMMPPAVSTMASTGLLSPGGVPPMMAPSSVLMKRIQMVRSGRCTEEQRQMLVQELQHHAAQGNPQAVAALNTLNLSNPMATSPTQSFTPQQQSEQLSPQQQSHQAYMAAVRMVKEKQQLQQQQQQQQQQAQQQQQQQRKFQQSPPQATSPTQQQTSQTQMMQQPKVQQTSKVSKAPPARSSQSPSGNHPQQSRMFMSQTVGKQQTSAKQGPQQQASDSTSPQKLQQQPHGQGQSTSPAPSTPPHGAAPSPPGVQQQQQASSFKRQAFSQQQQQQMQTQPQQQQRKAQQLKQQQAGNIQQAVKQHAGNAQAQQAQPPQAYQMGATMAPSPSTTPSGWRPAQFPGMYNISRNTTPVSSNGNLGGASGASGGSVVLNNSSSSPAATSPAAAAAAKLVAPAVNGRTLPGSPQGSQRSGTLQQQHLQQQQQQQPAATTASRTRPPSVGSSSTLGAYQASSLGQSSPMIMYNSQANATQPPPSPASGSAAPTVVTSSSATSPRLRWC